jgi:hypothetical protein
LNCGDNDQYCVELYDKEEEAQDLIARPMMIDYELNKGKNNDTSNKDTDETVSVLHR